MGVREINGTGGFRINTSSDDVGAKAYVRLTCASSVGSVLTPAAVSAILTAYSSYLTSGKAASLAQASEDRRVPNIGISVGGFSLPVLPADVNTVVGTMYGLLQTATNVEKH